ncbi:pyridoxal 5'-phosphate synthase glutaminase subu nit PdxT [Desulfonema ishimotonii]|uniref:glutaminase n=1 Tax=Desulfonema ishimotonii TaxID=45657 RepID=A0A401FXV0_9BACT|nr:pyridoxal 5'-phosphate synthase glutaminase subunit PdxT [Desulfonema ishimotonii]GBC61764.1 pyridoxal 5'-phosphate synthase glutaminase subu nit PdxT [Desulfonema ishimotonii]
MIVGLLGLQGAFPDHIRHLKRLDADYRVIRDAPALAEIDRLIIPGGESTVMGKFLEAFQMTAPLQERIRRGMPVWGICAGSILLAETADGAPGILGALPVAVKRNAYGRQIASAQKPVNVPLLDRPAFPGLFIRAPRIISMKKGVETHARCGDDPVFIQHGHVMATTFHPELTDDPVFHEYFLRL